VQVGHLSGFVAGIAIGLAVLITGYPHSHILDHFDIYGDITLKQ